MPLPDLNQLKLELECELLKVQIEEATARTRELEARTRIWEILKNEGVVKNLSQMLVSNRYRS